MKHKFLLIIVVVTGVFLGSVLISYYQLTHSNEVPLKNLKIRSTSGCYVNINIKNKSDNFKIVCPNEFLYQGLRKEKWIPFHFVYILRVGQKIKKNDFITLNDSTFKLFSEFVVDKHLIDEYRNKEILTDTAIVRKGYLNYTLNWEQKKAIIYELLNRGVNCCFSSEGGMNSIYIPILKNEEEHTPPL